MDGTEILKSLESDGGYAIILSLLILGLFYITREWQKGMATRAQARELLVRQDFQAQLERERSSQETIASMANRMITALDGNTRAIATITEVARETNSRLEVIDRYLAGVKSQDDGC